VQALLPDLDLEPLSPEEAPQPKKGSTRRNFALFIQIAGLIIGSWVVLIGHRLMPPRFTWIGLIGHALRYAFYTWAWSAAVTFLLYFTLSREERRDMAWNTLRVSSAAVWFAPAILLLSDWSPSTLAAGLVLTFAATRILYTQWRVMHPEPPLERVEPALQSLFGRNDLPRRGFVRGIAPPLASAALLQLGIAEIGMNRRFPAAALLVAGTSLLAIQAVSRGAWTEQRPASLPRSFFGAFLTILLAATLTITGMSGHVVPGGASGIADLFRQFFGIEQPPAAVGNADSGHARKPAAGNSDTALPKPEANRLPPAVGGNFPGVILRPEVAPVVTLIAPPSAVKNGIPSATPAHPFSIPFAGEYWMWRLGYASRPPANSFQQTGTPAELSFRTVDLWPLNMEARQKLIQPIDLACCAAVEIEIRNAETTAAWVQVELFAIGEKGEQSLGLAPLHSRPDPSQNPIVAVPETLRFVVPAHVTIGMMQDLKVVFRRMRAQAHRSAKIAIDRFLLVPR
jgi:hypothetical protein